MDSSSSSGDVAAANEQHVSGLSRVRFPARRQETPAELRMSCGGDERATDVTKLWQVYILGGVMVGRWAWARWKERSSGGLGGHA